MQQREVEIVNKLGLNAPASAKLTKLAAKYQCDVSLARSGRKVNAKSLMGVMMLAAGKGSRVVLETDGPDETEALRRHCRADRELFRRRRVTRSSKVRSSSSPRDASRRPFATYWILGACAAQVKSARQHRHDMRRYKVLE